METMELWINGEFYTGLESDGCFFKIPAEEAKWLNLDEGDVMEVKRVWHEE